MQLVILDGYGLNPGDLDFSPLEQFGSLLVHDYSNPDQVIERSKTADIVIVNKVRLSAAIIQELPSLKAVCLFATGYDNVDIKAAKDHQVAVYNAIGYGTESVAQHALAMILAWTNRVESHHTSVMSGTWAQQTQFSYSLHSMTELKGKSLGIIGYGRIGQRLAQLARAFGMKILALNRREKQSDENVTYLSLQQLLRQSDYLSLHAPLTDETRFIINAETIHLMKSTAVLINTGRGSLIDEDALAAALNQDQLAGAVVDVLQNEPPDEQHSSALFSAKNCLITPHMAWRSREARNNLVSITCNNIAHFLAGTDTPNRVV